MRLTSMAIKTFNLRRVTHTPYCHYECSIRSSLALSYSAFRPKFALASHSSEQERLTLNFISVFRIISSVRVPTLSSYI